MKRGQCGCSIPKKEVWAREQNDRENHFFEIISSLLLFLETKFWYKKITNI